MKPTKGTQALVHLKISQNSKKAMFTSKKKGKVIPTVDNIGWSVGFR
jgi:hypothetical protein